MAKLQPFLYRGRNGIERIQHILAAVPRGRLRVIVPVTFGAHLILSLAPGRLHRAHLSHPNQRLANAVFVRRKVAGRKLLRVLTMNCGLPSRPVMFKFHG
jgi:hypothetical protein